MEENTPHTMPDPTKPADQPWMMHYRGGHHHMLVKFLVGLIILAAVFFIGVHVGEFKGGFGHRYGHRGFYGQQEGWGMGAYPVGMPQNGMMHIMNGANSVPPSNSSTVSPAVPVAPTPAPAQ